MAEEEKKEVAEVKVTNPKPEVKMPAHFVKSG